MSIAWRQYRRHENQTEDIDIMPKAVEVIAKAKRFRTVFREEVMAKAKRLRTVLGTDVIG